MPEPSLVEVVKGIEEAILESFPHFQFDAAMNEGEKKESIPYNPKIPGWNRGEFYKFLSNCEIDGHGGGVNGWADGEPIDPIRKPSIYWHLWYYEGKPGSLDVVAIIKQEAVQNHPVLLEKVAEKYNVDTDVRLIGNYEYFPFGKSVFFKKTENPVGDAKEAVQNVANAVKDYERVAKEINEKAAGEVAQMLR